LSISNESLDVLDESTKVSSLVVSNQSLGVVNKSGDVLEDAVEHTAFVHDLNESLNGFHDSLLVL